MNEQLLNEFEAARLLGLTVSSLRTRRARPGPNPIPYIKVGRSVRYSPSELKKYLEQNTYDYRAAKRIA